MKINKEANANEQSSSFFDDDEEATVLIKKRNPFHLMYYKNHRESNACYGGNIDTSTGNASSGEQNLMAKMCQSAGFEKRFLDHKIGKREQNPNIIANSSFTGSTDRIGSGDMIMMDSANTTLLCGENNGCLNAAAATVLKNVTINHQQSMNSSAGLLSTNINNGGNGASAYKNSCAPSQFFKRKQGEISLRKQFNIDKASEFNEMRGRAFDRQQQPQQHCVSASNINNQGFGESPFGVSNGFPSSFRNEVGGADGSIFSSSSFRSHSPNNQQYGGGPSVNRKDSNQSKSQFPSAHKQSPRHARGFSRENCNIEVVPLSTHQLAIGDSGRIEGQLQQEKSQNQQRGVTQPPMSSVFVAPNGVTLSSLARDDNFELYSEKKQLVCQLNNSQNKEMSSNYNEDRTNVTVAGAATEALQNNQIMSKSFNTQDQDAASSPMGRIQAQKANHQNTATAQCNLSQLPLPMPAGGFRGQIAQHQGGNSSKISLGSLTTQHQSNFDAACSNVLSGSAVSSGLQIRWTKFSKGGASPKVVNGVDQNQAESQVYGNNTSTAGAALEICNSGIEDQNHLHLTSSSPSTTNNHNAIGNAKQFFRKRLGPQDIKVEPLANNDGISAAGPGPTLESKNNNTSITAAQEIQSNCGIKYENRIVDGTSKQNTNNSQLLCRELISDSKCQIKLPNNQDLDNNNAMDEGNMINKQKDQGIAAGQAENEVLIRSCGSGTLIKQSLDQPSQASQRVSIFASVAHIADKSSQFVLKQQNKERIQEQIIQSETTLTRIENKDRDNRAAAAAMSDKAHAKKLQPLSNVTQATSNLCIKMRTNLSDNALRNAMTPNEQISEVPNRLGRRSCSPALLSSDLQTQLRERASKFLKVEMNQAFIQSQQKAFENILKYQNNAIQQSTATLGNGGAQQPAHSLDRSCSSNSGTGGCGAGEGISTYYSPSPSRQTQAALLLLQNKRTIGNGGRVSSSSLGRNRVMVGGAYGSTESQLQNALDTKIPLSQNNSFRTNEKEESKDFENARNQQQFNSGRLKNNKSTFFQQQRGRGNTSSEQNKLSCESNDEEDIDVLAASGQAQLNLQSRVSIRNLGRIINQQQQQQPAPTTPLKELIDSKGLRSLMADQARNKQADQYGDSFGQPQIIQSGKNNNISGNNMQNSSNDELSFNDEFYGKAGLGNLDDRFYLNDNNAKNRSDGNIELSLIQQYAQQKQLKLQKHESASSSSQHFISNVVNSSMTTRPIVHNNSLTNGAGSAGANGGSSQGGGGWNKRILNTTNLLNAIISENEEEEESSSDNRLIKGGGGENSSFNNRSSIHKLNNHSASKQSSSNKQHSNSRGAHDQQSAEFGELSSEYQIEINNTAGNGFQNNGNHSSSEESKNSHHHRVSSLNSSKQRVPSGPCKEIEPVELLQIDEGDEMDEIIEDEIVYPSEQTTVNRVVIPTIDAGGQKRDPLPKVLNPFTQNYSNAVIVEDAGQSIKFGWDQLPAQGCEHKGVSNSNEFDEKEEDFNDVDEQRKLQSLLRSFSFGQVMPDLDLGAALQCNFGQNQQYQQSEKQQKTVAQSVGGGSNSSRMCIDDVISSRGNILQARRQAARSQWSNYMQNQRKGGEGGPIQDPSGGWGL